MNGVVHRAAVSRRDGRRFLARADAAISLLLVMVLHAAVFVTVSAEQTMPHENSAETLLHASLIVATPVQPTPPVPETVQITPQVRPDPPKRIKKRKRQHALTAHAPMSQASAVEPPPPPREMTTAAPAAKATPFAVPQPVPPRFDAGYLQNPAPLYPAMSRRLGEEGKVMLRVFVKPDGSPSQVIIQQPSGFSRLDTAAMDAVRQWRFVPARQGAERVGAWVLVPIAFSLRS